MSADDCFIIKVSTSCIVTTSERRQSKTLILSTHVAQKSLDCHLSPDINKWQSKTLFLAIFDPRSLIVKSFFDCRLFRFGHNGLIFAKVIFISEKLEKCNICQNLKKKNNKDARILILYF